MVLLPTDEIKSIINKPKADTAVGRDGNSINFIKQYKDLIISPFTHNFNLVLMYGTFPNIFNNLLSILYLKAGIKAVTLIDLYLLYSDLVIV